MNVRCCREIPRCAWRLHVNVQPVRYRLYSTGSSQPQAKVQLKSWQRTFLIGAIIGGVATPAWMYYDRQQHQSSFVIYKLVQKEPVSSTASIFHLEPADRTIDVEKHQAAWESGIWNVHFKQPQLQIIRAYTPLPPTTKIKDGKEELRFLIRHDPHGEVSSYLHRLPLGSAIELRGPNVEYTLAPDIRQVVFFAGGTGIAPAIQIARTMFDAKNASTDAEKKARENRKLHILWASRKREDCIGGESDAPPPEARAPPQTWAGMFGGKKKPIVPVSEEKGIIVKELEELKAKYPGQITVEYFVNAENTWIDENAVFNALSRFDDKDFSTGYATPQEQRQILISGPNGFISHLAGPKEWKNGREDQGPVSQIIAHAIAMNPHNVKVWKV